MAGKKSIDKWQFGDFQTPIELALKVVQVLKRNHAIEPDNIIEPTCGKGAFVFASAEAFKKSNIHGYEINPVYVEAANQEISSPNTEASIEVRQADFFDMDWEKEISTMHGSLLVIGNPPWVNKTEEKIMDKYRVKITYKYVDFVEVEADSEEEAKDMAPEFSEDAQYESLYDATAIKLSD